MRTDAFSKCHPAVNFIFFVGAIVSAVLIQHPAYLLAGVACSGLYACLLRGRGGVKLLVSMLPLFSVLTAINPLFNTYGETVLFECFGRSYTLEALYYGAAVAAIFVQMLLWLSCCTAVLTSDRFIGLFGNLIPALSLLLVMVLRLLPSLFRKAGQLSDARSAVGKGAKNGAKLREGITLLGALTSWALEGSVVTADSMRSRGYGSGKHTSFVNYTMRPSDWSLLVLQLLLFAAVFVFGDVAAVYTPKLSIAPLSGVSAPGFVAYCADLLIPSVLHIREVLQWHSSISEI